MPRNNRSQISRLMTQLKQRYCSDVLWHFVSREKNEEQSYKVLLSILSKGLKVGSQNEYFRFMNVHTKKMEKSPAYRVSCLADIPLKDLHIHAERYGQFAIGFHKASAIVNGYNPVLYVNQYSSVFGKFVKVRDEIARQLKKDRPALHKKFDELLYVLSTLSKSTDLKISPRVSRRFDQLQLNNFYYEREWRSISHWHFKNKDVALILLPQSKLERFDRDRKKCDLRVSNTTPILPFDLIYNV